MEYMLSPCIRDRDRRGQSVVEILVGIALAALFVIGAATIIAPSLKINSATEQIQTRTALATELESNVKAWAASNWNSVLLLATGTSNYYYLSTATSSFTVVSATSTSGTSASYATVTVDAVGPGAGGTNCASCNTLSWIHTVTSSGTSTLLVVDVDLGGSSLSGISISATYAGVPMTSAGYVYSDNGIYNGKQGLTQMFYLIAPTLGSNTVQVSLAGGTADDIEAGSVSFTGVNQTTPVENVTTVYGPCANNPCSGSKTVTTTVTSAIGDMVVDSVVNGSPVDSSNQTLQWVNNQSSNNQGGNGAQSTAAGAASVTMGYTADDDYWGMIGANLLAATISSGGSGQSSGTSTQYVGQTINVGTTTYYRYFSVNDVYRDSNGNVTTTATGNSYDPSTKQITVFVDIASSTLPQTNYTFYLTRNQNNVLSQSSWSGGSGQSGPVTLLSNAFADSSDVTVNSSGSIQLSTGGGVCVQ